jgi:hypothetical protein
MVFDNNEYVFKTFSVFQYFLDLIAHQQLAELPSQRCLAGTYSPAFSLQMSTIAGNDDRSLHLGSQKIFKPGLADRKF